MTVAGRLGLTEEERSALFYGLLLKDAGCSSNACRMWALFDTDARRDLLHDIGKLGVSNRILDKPGRPTGAEFAEVKKHPGLTYEILSRITPFRGIAATAANHHARLDGSGYHRGLTSDRLDLPSRVLAVAGVYEALTRDHPYARPCLKRRR